MSNPWFKFYPTDWRADPALRMCSPAARGVWIDMICLMHEANPYGHLLVNGHCPTDAQLAVLLGIPPEQFSDIQGELEQAGVFSRTREGVIYSRKMTRSAKKAATARRNGRKGGNPTLCKNTEKIPLDNPKLKGGDKTQKPEARSQSSSVTKVTAQDPDKIMFDSGTELLVASGKPTGRARSFLGKMRKAYGTANVIEAISKARREGAIDPEAFIVGCLKHATKKSDTEQFGAFGRIPVRG